MKLPVQPYGGLCYRRPAGGAGRVSVTENAPKPRLTVVPADEPSNEAGTGPLPVTVILKSEGAIVQMEGSSHITCFTTLSVACPCPYTEPVCSAAVILFQIASVLSVWLSSKFWI